MNKKYINVRTIGFGIIGFLCGFTFPVSLFSIIIAVILGIMRSAIVDIILSFKD